MSLQINLGIYIKKYLYSFNIATSEIKKVPFGQFVVSSYIYVKVYVAESTSL